MTGCVATLADVQGHALAQYFLGLMYRDSRATPQDSVLGHMWLNIAGANGEEIARESRDSLERDMTPAEIIRATDLARTCMTSNYENCGP